MADAEINGVRLHYDLHYELIGAGAAVVFVLLAGAGSTELILCLTGRSSWTWRQSV
jgi:hypothetical protein